MMNRHILPAAFTIMLGTLAAGADREISLPEIPLLSRPPVIDGRIAAGEYAEAWSGNLLRKDGKFPVNGTDVYMGYDSAALYVAWRCLDNAPEKIRRTWRTTEERDSTIWQDDCVEIICDPANTLRSGKYFHVIVNTAAVAYDAVGEDTAWNPDIRLMVTMDASGWTAEMAIPFSEMGITPPGAGDHWRVNLCRESPLREEYCSLKPGPGGFRNPNNFTEFAFRSSDETSRPGAAILSVNDASGWIRVASRSSQPLTVTATAAGTPPTGAELPSGKTVEFAAPQGAENGLEITVADADGNVIRSWRERKVQTVKAAAAATFGTPLYEELFAVPTGEKRRPGAFFWLAGVPPSEQRAYGIQFGEPQTQEEYFGRMAEYDLWGLMSLFTLEAHKLVEPGERFDNHYFLTPESRPEDRSIPHFRIDPASRKRYMDDMRTAIKKYPGRFKGVYFGDELDSKTEDAIIAGMAHRDEPGYEFIREMDHEVREKYGFGRYGIPESAADSEVLRWIAFRSCLNDRMVTAMRETHQAMHELIPDGIMVSDDPIASFDRVYDYADFNAGTVDVLTHQTYPGDALSDTGFFTKYMADLSEVPEIWPCMHIEEYGRSYTPDEVRLKISEGFRNGATGLHYFLHDIVGLRNGKKYLLHEFNGAPDRAQIEMALARVVQTLPPLKRPVPELGIYTPVETIRSYVGQHRHGVRTWVLHTRLERDARAAFVHLNEKAWSRRDRSGLKAVFVPDARYITENALKQLIAYVKGGGILIVLDNEAFSMTPAGEVPADRRTLWGEVKVRPRQNAAEKLFFGSQAVALANVPQYELQPDSQSRVIARYGSTSDTPIAAVERRLGKGRVVLFGANPVEEKTAASPLNGAYFRQLAKELGAKLDQDIWRFEFPKELIREIPYPVGRCLTGNSIVWRKFLPDFSCNDMANGASYRLDGVPLNGDPANTLIPLGEGRLTDRRRAITAPSLVQGKGKAVDWMDDFADVKPFRVCFDLGKTEEIDRIRLVYLYNMRPLKVRYSPDGKTFKEKEFRLLPEDNGFDINAVREKILPLGKTGKVRYVELVFSEADKRNKVPDLGLVEVEIWTPAK